MRRVLRCFSLAAALLALTLASGPALAHGHGGGYGGFHGGGGWHGGGGAHAGGWHGGGWYHPGFHGGFYYHHPVIVGGVGLPFAYPYYDPYYYDRPGAWTPGALTYVAPSPIYAAPLAGQCRSFQGDALVAGSNQPFYGSACLQPDGQWHIAS